MRLPLWALDSIVNGHRARERARERLLHNALLSMSSLLMDHAADRLLRIDSKVRHYFTNNELPPPELSPWAAVQRAGTDNGFLEMTALTRGAFELLHAEFDRDLRELWQACRSTNSQRGRPRKMNTKDCLALVLCYYHRTDCQSTLCQKFGVGPATLNTYLNEGRPVLLDVLRRVRAGRVTWPSPSKMQRLASKIETAQPHLKGCFAFVDGLNISIQNPSDPIEQNAYHNGWLCGTFCSNVFVFDSEGCIIWYRINSPGSWHDSSQCMGLYDLLRTKVPAGFGIAADSAFRGTGNLSTKVFKPLTETQLQAKANSSISVSELIKILRKHRAAVSVRQVLPLRARLSVD